MQNQTGKLTVQSNTDISLLECRGVIDTITSHTHHVVGLLQHLHNHELVLREHLSKPICPLNQVLNTGEALWQALALLGLQCSRKGVKSNVTAC